VPHGALPAGSRDRIRALELVDPALFVTLGLIMLSGRYMTPAAEGLVELIRSSISTEEETPAAAPARRGRSAGAAADGSSPRARRKA
jgi:hypothetical protein